MSPGIGLVDGTASHPLWLLAGLVALTCVASASIRFGRDGETGPQRQHEKSESTCVSGSGLGSGLGTLLIDKVRHAD